MVQAVPGGRLLPMGFLKQNGHAVKESFSRTRYNPDHAPIRDDFLSALYHPHSMPASRITGADFFAAADMFFSEASYDP
jgi:hypothetical protein